MCFNRGRCAPLLLSPFPADETLAHILPSFFNCNSCLWLFLSVICTFFFFFERFLSFSMTNWFDRHWYSNYNRLSVVQCAVAGGVQCICSVLWLVVVVCFSRLLISRKCLFFFFFPLGNKAVFCESECSLQPPVRQLCGPIHVLFSHEGTCIPNPCSVVQDEQFWDYRLWVRLMKSPKRHISRSETMY